MASGVFLAATLAMFVDVLIAGDGRIPSIPGEDLSRIFLYWNPFAFGELRHGHIVLWNPHSFAGAPFLAGFQAGLLYPPNWLHMVLPPALAINLGIGLHVFLAGLWTYVWTRHHGLHPVACVLAGLVFMFCGAHFLQLYRGHLPHQHTLVWAPLVFLAIDGVVETRALGWMLVGMAAVAMQILAGNVQYAYYTAVIAGLYAFWRWLEAGASWRTAVALAAIYGGGACLAAVQLFPGIAAVPESLRAYLSYETASGGALPPENILTFALPGLFGDEIAVPYWGRWTLSESSLFIGMAPSLLALYGIAGIASGGRRLVRVSAVMAVLALILAFGDHTPLFRMLYDHMPGFRSVRGVAKFGVLASAFVVMLTAVGFDRLVTTARAPRWLIGAAVGAGCVAFGLGWSLRADCGAHGTALWKPLLSSSDMFLDARMQFQYEPGASPPACDNTAGSLLLGSATALALAGLLAASRRFPRVVYAVALVGVVEVMVYARYTRPTFDSRPVLARVDEARSVLASHGAIETRVASSDPLQYLALAAGGDDVWGSADLVLERYARFLQSTQQWHVEAVLVAAGLRKMVAPLGMLRLSHELQLQGDKVGLRASGLDALPRALLVSRWDVKRDRDAVLAAMAERTFDPRKVVLLESDPGLDADADLAAASGTATVRDVSTEIMDVEVDVDRPAILLITDNYGADWRAFAVGDERRAYRILPANSTLRGIPLTSGHHVIRLQYRPRAYVVGAYVTMCSLLAYCAAAGIAWRRYEAQRRRSATA